MAFVPQLFTAPPRDPFLLRMALLNELSRRGVPFERLQEFLPFAHAPQGRVPQPADVLPAGTTITTPPASILPAAQRIERTPAELAAIAAQRRRALALATPQGRMALPTDAVPSRDSGFGWQDILNTVMGTSRGIDDPYARAPGSSRRPIDVQALQGGGVVTQPTVALLGEAGPEAVVPLTPEQRMPLTSEQIEPLPAPQFNTAQWAAIRAAPEGARIQVDDGSPYVKSGQRLVREQPPGNEDFTPAESAPSRVGHAAIRGAREAVEALPGLAMTALGTPSRVGGEVAELIRSPRTMGPQIWENAKQFALGLTGIPESLKTVFGQSTPREWQQLPETFVREAARTVTSVALTGGLGRLAKGTVKGALGPRSLIPGVAKGAEKTLHELAVPRARQLAAELRPLEGAVDRAFADLDAVSNVRLAMPVVRRRAQEMIDDLQKSSPAVQDNAPMIAKLEQLRDEAATGWTGETVRANVKAVGAQIGSTPNIPEGLARLTAQQRGSLLEAIYEDIDAAKPMTLTARGQVGAAGKPTEQTRAFAEQLHVAQRLSRREFASNELLRMVDKGIRKNKIDAEAIIGKIDDQLRAAAYERRAARFVGSWAPGELNAVKATLRSIAKTVPERRGLVRQAVEHGVTASVGTMVGGAPGAVLGAITPELITSALMTPIGRSLVRRAARMERGIGPQTRETLAALLRAQAAAERGELTGHP